MKTPFKLKSGNTSSFKNMGSSPLQQGKTEYMFKVPSGKAYTGGGSSRTTTLPSGKVTTFDPNVRQVIDPKSIKTKTKSKSLVSKIKKGVKKVISHPVTKKILKVGGLTALGGLKYDPKSGMSKKEYAKNLLMIKGSYKGGKK